MSDKQEKDKVLTIEELAKRAKKAGNTTIKVTSNAIKVIKEATSSAQLRSLAISLTNTIDHEIVSRLRYFSGNKDIKKAKKSMSKLLGGMLGKIINRKNNLYKVCKKRIHVNLHKAAKGKL